MFSGTVRELEPKDKGAVEEILDLYWSGDFRKHLSERLAAFIRRDEDVIEQGFKWYVADERGEVVGVAALRRSPDHMKAFQDTNNSAEFYVSAVRKRGEGVGTALREKRIEEAKRLGYAEAVFFGGESHSDSWDFHDRSGFVRVGAATAPDGERGQVWRMKLR